MNHHVGALAPDYFTSLYAADPDPWRFATSDYEHSKYADTLARLPRDTYASALEIGCSIGVFTKALAGRCGDLLAIDLAPAAIAAAQERCAEAPSARFAVAAVPAQWPDGRFDLIVLSEVAYYLGREELTALARRIVGALAPGGDLVMVHWTGHMPFALTGDAAAEALIAEAGGLDAHCHARTPLYRIDVLRAPGGEADGSSSEPSKEIMQAFPEAVR